MPPSAEEQQRTGVDVVGALFNWRREHLNVRVEALFEQLDGR